MFNNSTHTHGPRLSVLICAATLMAAASNPAQAQEQDWISVPLSLDELQLSEGAEAHLKIRAGRQTLCLNGKALINGLNIQAGSVAVDIANEQTRHFANIMFHANSLAEYETAYVRMHKSGQADALQYTPTFNNETNWQFYREAQTSAEFGDDDWVTLRVDFIQDRARVSLWRDNTEAGAFETDLTLSETGGGVGIRTLFEGCFSNLRYSTSRPDIPKADIAEPAVDSARPIREWSLSDAFKMEEWAGLQEDFHPAGTWQQVKVEPSNHLLISRYRKKAISGRFGRNGLDGVFAGVTLVSETAQYVDLSVDASDMATVFLNGNAVYAFDNSIRAKGPLFRGDVEQTSQTLRLPLSVGRNELIVLVAERANGWGLTASIVAPSSIRLESLGETQ